MAAVGLGRGQEMEQREGGRGRGSEVGCRSGGPQAQELACRIVMGDLWICSIRIGERSVSRQRQFCCGRGLERSSLEVDEAECCYGVRMLGPVVRSTTLYSVH